MKYLLSLLSILLSINSALADTRETIFEGFDAKLVSIVDDMTDKKSGAIFLNFDQITLAIYGHNDYTIWSNEDDLLFAFDGKHLIHVGKMPPFSLKTLNKKNALSPSNNKEAEAVIRSLVKGEEIKIRYVNWPKYEQIDKTIQHPTLGSTYNKAVKSFKWKDLGISSEPGPVKLSVYMPSNPDDIGYASVRVVGNSDLQIDKNFDKYGGGALIEVAIKRPFGLHKGNWVSGAVEPSGNKYLIIRNAKDQVVFKKELPTNHGNLPTRTIWPDGEQAAKAAWESAPLGSIEVEGSYQKRVPLYGFKELWRWGIENAGFPPLE